MCACRCVYTYVRVYLCLCVCERERVKEGQRETERNIHVNTHAHACKRRKETTHAFPKQTTHTHCSLPSSLSTHVLHTLNYTRRRSNDNYKRRRRRILAPTPQGKLEIEREIHFFESLLPPLAHASEPVSCVCVCVYMCMCESVYACVCVCMCVRAARAPYYM